MITRQLPWHQLGTDVKGTNSSLDALTLASLDWKVKSNPIYDASGKVIPNFKANTREDTNQVLGIVKDRYSIVQNNDAFAFTDDLLGDGVSYERAGLFHNGRAIWLLAKMPGTKILDDSTDPYMIFVNSHDGTGSIKIALCPIRIVCSNAINAQLQTARRSWSAVHSGNVMYRLEEAKRALGLADDYMKKLNIEAAKMATKKFSDDQFEGVIEALFPTDENTSARKLNNIREIKKGLFDCLDAPDVKKYKDTAYGKYLAVTDYFDHADPTRNTPTFAQTRWENIANGYGIVDSFFGKLIA